MTVRRRAVELLALVAGGLVVAVLATTLLHPTAGAYVATVDGTRETVSSSGDFASRSLPVRSAFAGSDAGWTTNGGCWRTSVHNGFGIDADECDHDGDAVALNGSPDWTDVTVQADVKIDAGSEAGLLVRVDDPSASGSDPADLDAVAVTVDTTSTLRIVRQDGTARTELGSTAIVSGISPNTWYHVVVAARGCTVTAWQTTVGANTWTRLSATDDGCRTTGAVGLVDRSSRAAWRFLTVTDGAADQGAPDPTNATFATGASGGTTTSGSFRVDQTAETLSGAPDSALRSDAPRAAGSLTTALRFDTAPGNGAALGAVLDDGTRSVRAVLDGTSLRLDTAATAATPSDPWSTATRSATSRPVAVGDWWHLTLSWVGCSVVATVQPTDGGSPTTVSASTPDCGATSTPGLLVAGAGGSWRETATTSG